MLQLCTCDTQHSKYCFCSAVSNYFCLICPPPLDATTFIFTVAVTSYIDHIYFTYWTQLLHILNTITSYIEHSYFTYWTQLLHILNTVTARAAHSYCTRWTQLLHTLHTVTAYIERHRLLFVFGSCQDWISAIISGFVAVLFSPPEQSSTSSQTTTARCTPFPAHHSLTILPFAQFHLLTDWLTDRVVNKTYLCHEGTKRDWRQSSIHA